MPPWKAGIQLAPLRPFDRIVAGYATLAFAVGAGESAVMREWSVTLVGVAMAALGVALLLHDHRRWRAERQPGTPAAAKAVLIAPGARRCGDDPAQSV